MFRSDMTPEDARAELLRLKLSVWPHAFALLDAFVPSPQDPDATMQSDWLDAPEGVGLHRFFDGGLVYCRTALGQSGPDLVGMIGFRHHEPSCSQLRTPTAHECWEGWASANGPHEPFLTMFRKRFWGRPEITRLRAHLPIRWFVGAQWYYSYIWRPEILALLADPTPGLVSGARIGFRVGDAMVLLADPEHGECAEVQCPEDPAGAAQFREDTAVLDRVMRHPLVTKLVPADEGVPELRARAAGR